MSVLFNPPPTSEQTATVTRFAPSPTGHLHLGHAYAALVAAAAAHESSGRFVLRLEDIDKGRCRAEYEQTIMEDLKWLGLTWDEPILKQSSRYPAYEEAIGQLRALGLIYPCFCTRKDIRLEIERAGAAPHGPDGNLYPGTCRSLGSDETRARFDAGEIYALRLNMVEAINQAGPLTWTDETKGLIDANPAMFGDIVLARKDSPASYHLAVTLDDQAQDITLVTRGKDLFPSTHVHRLLQALLGLDTPHYKHHNLILGEDGKKFSKRDTSATLRSLRASGQTPGDIYYRLGFSPDL